MPNVSPVSYTHLDVYKRQGVGDAESISVYSAASGKAVVSASEALKRIQVFTPMGRLVRTLYPARPTYTFALPAGIYICLLYTSRCV